MTQHDSEPTEMEVKQLTVEEAADKLGISVRHLWRLVEKGVITPVRDGSRSWFSDDTVNSISKRNWRQSSVRRIYVIKNDFNNSKYVGSTAQLLRERWNNHLSCLRSGADHPLYNDMRLMGVERFRIEEIDVIFDDMDAAEVVEAKYIVELKSHVNHGGYNRQTGPGSIGRNKKPVEYGEHLKDGDPRLCKKKWTYSWISSSAGISTTELENLVRSGLITPFVTPGGRVFFVEEHINQVKKVMGEINANV